MSHLNLTPLLYAPAITAAAIFTNAAWARASEGFGSGAATVLIFTAASMIVFLIASGVAALLLQCGVA